MLSLVVLLLGCWVIGSSLVLIALSIVVRRTTVVVDGRRILRHDGDRAVRPPARAA